MVAEMTLELKHNMGVQEVHTVEVWVPMRNSCDSPNYGCTTLFFFFFNETKRK